MNCNRCNKQGAKPYKYNNGGVITDVYLCDDCFKLLSSSDGGRRQTEERAFGREQTEDSVPVSPRGRGGADPLSSLAVGGEKNPVRGDGRVRTNADLSADERGRGGNFARNAEVTRRENDERVNAEGREGENSSKKSERASDKSASKTRSGSILGLETKCPTCGASFQEIKRTGYLGCADCFTFFKSRLEPVIDKFQGGVISNREKKQFEMTVMMLEHEYMSLSEKLVEGDSDGARRRMTEIEKRLAAMGVKVDV